MSWVTLLAADTLLPIPITQLGPWGVVILTVGTVITALIRRILVTRGEMDKAEREYAAGVERNTATHKAETDRLVAAHDAEMKRLVEGWKERLAESVERERYWRDATGQANLRAEMASRQVDELMEVARSTQRFFNALPRAREEVGNEHST